MKRKIFFFRIFPFLIAIIFSVLALIACNTDVVSGTEGSSSQETVVSDKFQDAGTEIVPERVARVDEAKSEAHEHGEEEEHDHTPRCVTIGGYCAKANESCKSGTKGSSAMGCHDESGAEGKCCIPTKVNVCEAKGGYCVKAGSQCKSGDVQDSAACLNATDICCASESKSNCVRRGGYCAAKEASCKTGYISGARMGCPGAHEAVKCCKPQ